MKRFIVSILCITTFFIGLGGLIDTVGARFKSDEKALELLRKARQAVGGDSALAGVRSMTITGKVTKNFDVEGSLRSEQGDLEINFELPNKMSRSVKLGNENAAGEAQLIDKRVDVVVVGKGDGDNLKFRVENPDAPKTDGARKIIIQKPDGTTEEVTTEGKQQIFLRKDDGEKVPFTTEDGKKVFISKDADVLKGAHIQQNELFRTTLALLLTAPEGLDVSYNYAGEGSVDGASCDIIDAQIGGASVKLYLDKSSSLPRMMTYQAVKPFMIKINKDEAKSDADGKVRVFTRELPKHEMAEFQVKFSDFRSVNGLQLPFRWTQTVAGKEDESIDITSYEINPANIGDKFKEMPQKVLIRTQKPQQ